LGCSRQAGSSENVGIAAAPLFDHHFVTPT
jgi:hypothetical protein